MRAVTVHFTRVFDIQHTGGARVGTTSFSGELADGSRHFGLNIPARVDIKDGSSWTFFVPPGRELSCARAVRDDASGTVYREGIFLRVVWPMIELGLGVTVAAMLLLARQPLVALAPLLWAGAALLYLAAWRRESAAIAAIH